VKDLIKKGLKDLGLDGFKAYLKSNYQKYFFTDEEFIRKEFRKRLGREVDLEDPKKFNDKLQWLKLNWRDPLATKCSDKYKVREYVKEKIGEEILNELYGVYKSVDEINFKELPESFVLKANHGSGWNIICKDKKKMNWRGEFRRMKWWMRTNYYYLGREWVYDSIEPRIVCEKYLSGEDSKPPKDYKIFCFNGEPKIIEVDFDRHTDHKRNFYDLDWNFLDLEIKYPNVPSKNIKKPEKLEKMIEYSKILSENFPHVRVDLYEVNNKIYFGELSFFHGSGMQNFRPEEFELKMGEWLELPKN